MSVSRLDSAEASFIVEKFVSGAGSAVSVLLVLPLSAFIAFVVVFELTFKTFVTNRSSFVI